MHSSLIGKIAKARIYAEERDRITIESIACEIRGDNASHTVQLREGVWQCDCHFFAGYDTCSHAMALGRILSGMLPAEPALPPAATA